MTGDRDILQVVDDHITVLTSGRFFSDTIYYTPESVKAKYGLEPDQLVDYKALIGDKSDNIPGVKGIGEKGATELLQRYGTLDAVYADIDNVAPNRAQAALKAGKADAELSHKLGKIVTDVPISSWTWKRAAPGATTGRRSSRFSRSSPSARWPNALPPPTGRRSSARALLPQPTLPRADEGGADGALRAGEPARQTRVAGAAPSCPRQPGPKPILVVTAARAHRSRRAVGAAPRSSRSTPRPPAPTLTRRSWWAWRWPGAPALDQAAYIPIGHCDTTCLPWDTVRAALAPAFENPDIEKIAHNASYDIGILDRYGLQVNGQLDRHDDRRLADRSRAARVSASRTSSGPGSRPK